MSEILGVLFATFIVIMMVPNFLNYQKLNNENLRAMMTSKQQKLMEIAATNYIQQNSFAIQSVATSTNPAIITVSMLQSPAVKLLDTSFSATNPFGQTWQIEVLQPSAGDLQALVLTTGGTSLTDLQVTKIAAISGGGFIPLNDSGIYPNGSANAYGAFGWWTVPTTNYTSIAGGHLASLLTFNRGQLSSNYLYRNSIPGQPQLNEMNTSLNLKNNNISNADTVNGNRILANGSGSVGSANNGYYDISGGRIAAGSSVYSYNSICAGNNNGDCSGTGGVVINAAGNVNAAGNMTAGGETTTDGWFRTTGDTGWYSNKWGGGFYMSDGSWVRTYNDKNMYTGGQMQAGALRSNSTLSVAGDSTVGGQQLIAGNQTVGGKIMATSSMTPGQIAVNGGSCGGYGGAIARDSNNNLYVCN